MTQFRISARLLTLVALLALGTGRLVSADTITFETIPSGTPTDNQNISMQYWSAYGVSFHLWDVNTNAISTSNGGEVKLAMLGESLTGFLGPAGGDTVQAGQGVGNFFLTDDGLLVQPIALLINYAVPVATASGQILDIDQFAVDPDGEGPEVGNVGEAWQVRAFSGQNGTGSVVDTQYLNVNSTNAGDGTVTPFGFLNTTGFMSLIIQYDTVHGGVFPNGVGFAFDNFSAATAESFFTPGDGPIQLENFVATPEPATVTTSVVGIGYLAYLANRRRRKTAIAQA